MNRPLKFLHLTTFYPPYHFGGDAIQVYRLAHALGDSGHHVDVIHCVDSYHLLHPGAPALRFPEHPNVARHELRSGYKSLSPLLTQQTGRPLLKQKSISEVLKSRPYDVIHFHNISLLGPAVLSIVPPQGQAVKIYTTHEHWLICPTHVLWKFNQAPCQTPECLRCTIQAKRPPQFWRYTGLLKRMSEHVDQFVAPSRFTAKMHAERGFPRPVDHLPNFMERIDQDWRAPAPRPQEGRYFLFVGRLEWIKGLQTLIALWDRVQYDLLVVGEGSQSTELRTMAASNPRIKFLGALPPHELGALYYHAIASIVPSITYETFGMTSVESFARKTPAIVRDLGGLPEVVQDSGGGFVYRSDEDLLRAIGQLGASERLRTELGLKGYGGFLQWWCREAHLRRYFDYLSTAASRRFGRIPWDESVCDAGLVATSSGRV